MVGIVVDGVAAAAAAIVGQSDRTLNRTQITVWTIYLFISFTHQKKGFSSNNLFDKSIWTIKTMKQMPTKNE